MFTRPFLHSLSVPSEYSSEKSRYAKVLSPNNYYGANNNYGNNFKERLLFVIVTERLSITKGVPIRVIHSH